MGTSTCINNILDFQLKILECFKSIEVNKISFYEYLREFIDILLNLVDCDGNLNEKPEDR